MPVALPVGPRPSFSGIVPAPANSPHVPAAVIDRALVMAVAPADLNDRLLAIGPVVHAQVKVIWRIIAPVATRIATRFAIDASSVVMTSAIV